MIDPRTCCLLAKVSCVDRTDCVLGRETQSRLCRTIFSKGGWHFGIALVILGGPCALGCIAQQKKSWQVVGPFQKERRYKETRQNLQHCEHALTNVKSLTSQSHAWTLKNKTEQLTIVGWKILGLKLNSDFQERPFMHSGQIWCSAHRYTFSIYSRNGAHLSRVIGTLRVSIATQAGWTCCQESCDRKIAPRSKSGFFFSWGSSDSGVGAAWSIFDCTANFGLSLHPPETDWTIKFEPPLFAVEICGLFHKICSIARTPTANLQLFVVQSNTPLKIVLLRLLLSQKSTS